MKLQIQQNEIIKTVQLIIVIYHKARLDEQLLAFKQ
jgi:hypothetical protein